MAALTREKVIEAIGETGFPLELRTASLFARRGYAVASSLYYVDRDEGKGREIDLRVLLNRRRDENGVPVLVRHCLLVECKRYKKRPWVIFTNEATPYDKAPSEIDIRGITNPKATRALVEQLTSTHPLFNVARVGRGYTELFRESNHDEADSPIFSALTTAVKATLAAREESFAAGTNSICVYYPLVVLEGILWEAFLQEGAIEANEQDRIVVSFFYQSSHYPNECFRVPVVTEAALPRYVDELEASLDVIDQYFRAHPEYFKK